MDFPRLQKMARLDADMITFNNENDIDTTTKKSNFIENSAAHEKFVAKIAKTHEWLEVTGEYINAKTGVRCRCRKCGYELEIIASNLSRMKQCAKCAGRAPITHEDFLQRVNNNPNNASIAIIGKYDGAHSKVLCQCNNCGTRMSLSPRLLYSGKGCPQCSGHHKKTHEEFVEELYKINKDIEVVGKYVNSNTHIECKCCVCGTYWKSKPSNLLQSTGCPECGEKRRAASRRKPHSVFANELEKVAPTIALIGQYQGDRTNVECQCMECGHVWKVRPSDLLKSKSCPQCAIKKRAEAQIKPHEQFVDELKSINPQILVLGQYVKSSLKIECECLRCKRKFSSAPSDLLKGRGCSWCARSSSSFLERALFLFLKHAIGENHVFHRDRTAIGMELDVYINSNFQVAIEPGDWRWHESELERDNEKRKLCYERGIRLITIYDGFNGDRDEFGFCEDIITYEHRLGELKNRNEAKECIKNIFKILNIEYSFSEDEESVMLLEAKSSTTRKTKDEVAEELKSIHPNIKLLSDYKGCEEKMLCHCNVCSHEWKQIAYKLIAKKIGCPVCSGIQKPVVNLDTGETFGSIADAAKCIGCDAERISKVCNGKQDNYRGSHWAFILNLTETQLKDLREKFPGVFKY